MSKRLALGFSFGLCGPAAAWVGYDFTTMSKLRGLTGWTAGDSAVRASNVLADSGLRPLPAYSLQQLAENDGAPGRKTFICAGGIVYDVSSSDSFGPGGPYGAWRGKDATVSLASSSLDPRTAESVDWTSLSGEEWEALDSWVRYFDEKYLRVGRLEEFTGFRRSLKRSAA